MNCTMPGIGQSPLLDRRGGRSSGRRGCSNILLEFHNIFFVALNPTEKAPTGEMIREMTPERIFASLTSGSMQMQSEGLDDGQKRVIAEFMSGRTLGSAAVGDAKNMPNKCSSNPAMTDPARSPA